MAKESSALRQVRAELYKKSLREYTRAAFSSVNPGVPLVWNWHLDALCDHLEALYHGQIKQLAVTMPFRLLKSTLVAVMLPTWGWAKDPSLKMLSASYSQELAGRDATRSRTLIGSPWYQNYFGDSFALSGDVNRITRYENTGGGYRIVVSVNALGTTGEGGDLNILDDPHDVQRAESYKIRRAACRWYWEAFYNRYTDPKLTRRLICGQRTQVSDLFSEAIASGLFVHLNMPMEYDPRRSTVTSLGWSDPRKEPGELIFPEFLPAEECENLKKGMGSYAWEAQANQNPRPREGVHFKRAWFQKTYRATEDTYQVGDDVFLKKQCVKIAVADPAGGESDAADDTGLGALVRTPKNHILISEVVGEHLPLTAIVKGLFDFSMRNGVSYVVFEEDFLQSFLAKKAREYPGMPPVKGVRTQGRTKFERAQPAIIMAEAGQIYVPEGNPYWLEPFLDQVCSWTAQDGEADDMVDVLAYGCARFDSARGMVGGLPYNLGGGYGGLPGPNRTVGLGGHGRASRQNVKGRRRP